MSNFTEEVVLRLRDEFSSAASNISKNAISMSGALKGIGAAFAVGAGINFLKDSVVAFAENEKEVLKLRGALQSLGVTSQAVLSSYTSFAKEIEKTTFFTDEQTLSAIALVTQHGIAGEEMKRLIKISTDLATAYGEDLGGAALKLIKAGEGNVKGLKAWNIEVSELALRTGGLSSVLAAAENKMGGFAASAQGGTASALDQFGKNIDDIKKGIGGMIVEMDKAIGLSDKLSKALKPDTKMWEDFLKVQNAERTRLEDLGVWEKSNKEGIKSKPRAPFEGEGIRQYQDTLMSMQKSTVGTFGQIANTYQQDKEKFARLWRDKKISVLEYYDGLIAATQKNSIDEMNLISSTLDQSTSAFSSSMATMQTNVVKGFSEMSSSSLKIIGSAVGGPMGAQLGLAGSIVSTVTGIVSAVSDLFAAFDNDSRSSFQKLHDYISQINSDIQAGISALREVQRLREKKEGGLAGEVSFDPNTIQSEANAVFGTAPTYTGKKGKPFSFSDVIKGLLAEGTLGYDIDDATGIVSIIWDGTTIVLHDPVKGDWEVVHVIYRAFTSTNAEAEQLTLEVAKFVLAEAKKQGLNLGALGVPVSDRATTRPGIVLGTPNGSYGSGSGTSSYAPAAAIGSSASPTVIINVQAMDEKGVADFLRDKLAPAMRHASGRNGMVLINSKGVSANA